MHIPVETKTVSLLDIPSDMFNLRAVKLTLPMCAYRWAGLATGAVAACIYAFGWGERYPAEPGRALAADIEKLPVVVLSHGIGANRYLYSTLCAYLAQHGFIVVAVEHTDGLASAAKPAGDRYELPLTTYTLQQSLFFFFYHVVA
jgi:hypothetical protein